MQIRPGESQHGRNQLVGSGNVTDIGRSQNFEMLGERLQLYMLSQFPLQLYRLFGR